MWWVCVRVKWKSLGPFFIDAEEVFVYGEALDILEPRADEGYYCPLKLKTLGFCAFVELSMLIWGIPLGWLETFFMCLVDGGG